MMYISLFSLLNTQGNWHTESKLHSDDEITNLDSQLDIPAPASPLHYLTFNADCFKAWIIWMLVFCVFYDPD